MSSIRTTLHHYLSSQLFIRTIHLSPNTVGFQPLIWSPDNQFSYQPGRLIFRPAPPAAKLQNRPLYRSEEGQRLQIFRRWTTTWNSFQLVKRRRDRQPVVPSSGSEDPLRYEDPVMQISGTGHWFLEGWIGDHSVDFLVDSGSSVTAM